MAKNTINFNAKLNIDVQAQMAEFDKIEKRVKTIAEGGKFAPKGGARQKEAVEIQKDMERLKKVDTTGMNRRELVKHEAEILAIKQRYAKLINGIAGAEIAGLARTKEQKDALEEVNTEYRRITESINGYLKKIKEVEDKTTKIIQAQKDTADATGIDVGTLQDPGKLQEEIKKRTRLDGKPRKGEEDNLKKLNELQKLYNDEKYKGIETLEKLDAKAEGYTAELEKQTVEAEKQRENKNKINQEIIKSNYEAGEISDTEKEILEDSKKQLDIEEEKTEEIKKQEAIKSSGATKKATKDAKDQANANNNVKKSFLGKVTAATLYYAALRTLRKLMTSVISTVRELDKSITEVAMVTNMNREEAWQLVDAYQNLAKEVGATTEEIAKLSVFFFRQGRTAKDALELTKVAATAAKVAAIDATESANYLTSAINGFGLAADQAMAVSDRFAALGASSASSYEEMAVALSKVAPVAKTAGVGIDFMMAILAKGIETTREAPENIGTAFKTVFARMTQIREFGATLDDAVGVNRVEDALAQADVQLRDSSGNFRDMDVVLTELGVAFDGLTRNQQAYIATALAGTRQQSRLLAVMQNFDRTMELVDISMTASGATLAQHAIYAGGMQAATARLTTSWQELILTFSDTEVIIDIINGLAKGVSSLADEFKRNGKLIVGLTIAVGVGFVAAFMGAKIAALGFAGALASATGGISLILPAIIGLAGILYGLFREPKSDAEKFAEASKELSANIKQNQVDMYNLGKEAKDIEKLRDRYDELNDQVIKTSEEMEEMNDLAEQIKKIASEDYGITMGVDVDVTDAAQLVLDQLAVQQDQALVNSIGLGQQRVDQAVELGGLDKILGFDAASEMDSVYNAIASSLFGRENFINANAEQQAEMIRIARNNANLYIQDQIDFQDILRDFNEENNFSGIVGLMDLIGFSAEDINAVSNAINNIPDIELGAKRNFLASDVSRELLLESFLDNVNRVFEDTPELQLDKTTGADVMNQLFEQMFDAGVPVDEIDVASFLNAYVDFIEEGLSDIEYEFQDHPTFTMQTPEIKSEGAPENDFLSGQEILDYVQRFNAMLNNELTIDEYNDLWADFMGLGETAQNSIINNIEEIKELTGLGFEAIQAIFGAGITTPGVDGKDRSLTVGEKQNIAKILTDAGFDKEAVVGFFTNMEEITAESINTYLDGIEDSLQRGILEEGFFGFLTGDGSVQKFANEIEKTKNSVKSLMDLQEKFQTEGLTSEELATVTDMLSGTGLLDDFLAGNLEAEDYASGLVNAQKKALQDARDLVQGELERELAKEEEDQDKAVIQSLEDELLLYNTLFENIEEMVYDNSGAMAEFYQSQIDYIKQINSEKQKELDLEQKKIDMNRSMLSLNRQIRALESDTSYGSQAKLEDLRMTRNQEALNREKFIMDMIANQQISDLQNEIQNGILGNTAVTAEAVDWLAKNAGKEPSDNQVIHEVTGFNVRTPMKVPPGTFGVYGT